VDLADESGVDGIHQAIPNHFAGIDGDNGNGDTDDQSDERIDNRVAQPSATHSD
jgi:hypothetical protein